METVAIKKIEDIVNLEIVKSTLQNILERLFKNDRHLLEITVKEEAINFRLGAYLIREGFEDIDFNDVNFNVDLEYNKNLLAEKQIKSDEINLNIRPDIVIHERGKNNFNLIAFECKKGYVNKNDKLKLEKLLLNPYNYFFTVGVSYLPNSKHFRVHIFSKRNENIVSEVLKICKSTYTFI